MEFEWDPAKDRSNRRKHGVSAIGPIDHGIVVVVYTEREEGRFRIIGARWATKREQDLYFSHKDRFQ